MTQAPVHKNPYQPAKHNLATARSKATGILLFFVAVFAIVAELILDIWLTKGGRSIHPFGVQASVISNYLAGFVSLATASCGLYLGSKRLPANSASRASVVLNTLWILLILLSMALALAAG